MFGSLDIGKKDRGGLHTVINTFEKCPLSSTTCYYHDLGARVPMMEQTRTVRLGVGPSGGETRGAVQLSCTYRFYWWRMREVWAWCLGGREPSKLRAEVARRQLLGVNGFQWLGARVVRVRVWWVWVLGVANEMDSDVAQLRIYFFFSLFFPHLAWIG